MRIYLYRKRKFILNGVSVIYVIKYWMVEYNSL